MPIPTTPLTITLAIREKVAIAFDKLEEDTEGPEADQKACCAVITFSGEGEGRLWGFEEGMRVVDWEGLSEQCVRNLCHFLPGLLEELGDEVDEGAEIDEKGEAEKEGENKEGEEAGEGRMGVKEDRDEEEEMQAN